MAETKIDPFIDDAFENRAKLADQLVGRSGSQSAIDFKAGVGLS